jgi:hypothetical protein
MNDEAAMEKLALSIQPSDLESPELRTEATGSAASKVDAGKKTRKINRSLK